MLAACASSQKPYVIGSASAAVDFSYGGNTPAQACREFAVAIGTSYTTSTQNNCMVASVATNYPVIQACDPLSHSPFSMSVAEGVQLSALILSVWVSAAIFRWFTHAVRDKGGDES